MIKEKLLIVEKKLVISLEEIRASYSHRGDRGSVAETIVRDLLREYLPPQNRIGQGEIIDTKESISTQLDIVITNEYHPYLNDLKDPGLFIIEGVACAGEVKTNLNSNDLTTLIQSCIKYKQLEPVIPKGTTSYGNKSDLKRFVNHRPYFIFAYQSQITIETIAEKLNRYYAENNTPIVQQIDAVFSLDRGAIINFADGQGGIKLSTPTGAQDGMGLIVTKTGKEGVLLELMFWLSVVIHRYSLPSSPLLEYFALRT